MVFGGKEKVKKTQIGVFCQVMKDMGCRTFREMKVSAWDTVERRQIVTLNQS